MSATTVSSYYDTVIVGAGAAGLSAALSILRSDEAERMRTDGCRPKILVVSKLQALRSHTGSAEGGIAASLGNIEHDDWHWHYYDTIKGGDWLADQDAVRILAKDAPKTVIALEHDGVAFSRTEDGHIAQRKFGGHTANFGKEPVERAAYAADRIGHQILYALWQQCTSLGVQFAEEWYVTDLVLGQDTAPDQSTSDTEPQRSQSDTTNSLKVEGIVALDTHTGAIHTVQAQHVLLATGGAGRLFHTTTNSWDLTGDGMALALNAGLQLEDIEFMQFHPTGLAHTGILLSEASRGEGGILRNANGEAFMARYAPEHRDLAARDVVSRSIMAEVDAGRGVCDPKDPNGPKDCVWLDMTGIDPKRMNEALPQVLETIRLYAGIDPTHDWVPVKPTAHYTMGGIPVTTHGHVYQWINGKREEVRGLYAAGECSCVSVHGANRLGGNSLLDACLFGSRAGNDIATSIAAHADTDKSAISSGKQTSDSIQNNSTSTCEQQARRRKEEMETRLSTTSTTQPEGNNPYSLLAQLGDTMEHALAVRCSKPSIQTALDEITQNLVPQVKEMHTHSSSPAFNQELTAIWEVHNLIEVAQAMLHTSAARHESRGAFHREDFPSRNDTDFLQHSMVAAQGTVDWQPVHIVDMPPEQRAY